MASEKSFDNEFLLFGKNEDGSVFALAVEGDACALEPLSPSGGDLLGVGIGLFGGDHNSWRDGVDESVLAHAVLLIAPANPNVGSEVDSAVEKRAFGFVACVGGD